MSKEMLINVSAGEECRIAVLENGRLDDFHIERNSNTSHVGNIYKGKVTNVEPSIQAAFVDFGLGRNGFLHISDLQPSYFGRRGEEYTESVGRKLARRDRPPIQKCLRRGDEILVQIIKEGIGTKGPTLSTYLSIPGHILVMMPGMDNFGVSRKIEDETERRRLRRILDELDPVEGVGFIVRTAGMGKTKDEIQRDLNYLTRLWNQMQRTIRDRRAPVELYTEGDLVTRTVRDVYTPDIQRIVVDKLDVARRIRDFFKLTTPETARLVEFYDGATPLFHAAGVEDEIEKIYARNVPLPSGGSLVIDSTEAIVAIDVNSGKFREHSDAETTAFKTDLEAADEICRQLKLRDLGGVIICDFIDLRAERHRRELEQRILDHFKRDRAKTKVLRMSQFGIIEITRQRMRPSLQKAIHATCPHCSGTGWVKTPESLSLDLMRQLTIAALNEKVVKLELTAAVDAGNYLLNRKRAALAELEQRSGKSVEIKVDSQFSLDEFKLDLLDARDGKVFLAELGMTPETGGRGRVRGQAKQRPVATARHAQQLLRKLATRRVDELDDDRTADGDWDSRGVDGRVADHDEPDVADVDVAAESDDRDDRRTTDGRASRDRSERDGYDRDGRDRDGRGRDGRDRDGYDRDGRDRDGRGRDGRDRGGYDRDGRDRDGRERDGRDSRSRGRGDRYDGRDPASRERDSSARDGGGRGRGRPRDTSTPHQPVRAEDLLASSHTSDDSETVDTVDRVEDRGGRNPRGGRRSHGEFASRGGHRYPEQGFRDDRGDRDDDRADGPRETESRGQDGPGSTDGRGDDSGEHPGGRRRRRRRGGRGRNRNRDRYNQGYDDTANGGASPANGSAGYEDEGYDDESPAGATGDASRPAAIDDAGYPTAETDADGPLDSGGVAGSDDGEAGDVDSDTLSTVALGDDEESTDGEMGKTALDDGEPGNAELGDAPEEVVDENPGSEPEQPGIPAMPTTAELGSYDEDRDGLTDSLFSPVGTSEDQDDEDPEDSGEEADDEDNDSEDADDDAPDAEDGEEASSASPRGRGKSRKSSGKKSSKSSKKAAGDKPAADKSGGDRLKSKAKKSTSKSKADSKSEAKSAEPVRRRPVRTPPPGVKTGAGDRHLAHDEPAAGAEPPRRPRSYRDLDAIPDDYD